MYAIWWYLHTNQKDQFCCFFQLENLSFLSHVDRNFKIFYKWVINWFYHDRYHSSVHLGLRISFWSSNMPTHVLSFAFQIFPTTWADCWTGSDHVSVESVQVLNAVESWEQICKAGQNHENKISKDHGHSFPVEIVNPLIKPLGLITLLLPRTS